MRPLFYWFASVLIAAMLSAVAHAHSSSVGYGTVNIAADKTHLMLALPAYLFTEADVNADRLLQPQEIQQGRQAIIRSLEQWITLRVGGESGEVIDDQIQVSIHLDNLNSTPQIEWLRQLRFSDDASQGSVTVSLDPQLLNVDYLLQANRGNETEVAVFSATQPRHTFFKTATETVSTFLSQGLAHIYGGYDHVLFLMTLLASQLSVRRWLWVLTAFTLAHATTFTLASLGYVALSPALVEPAIALSIVVVALVRLLRCQPTVYAESLGVFSIGLFHGLGFASAIADLFTTSHYPVSAIVGFNLGIEIGQISIAAAVALVFWSIRRYPRLKHALIRLMLGTALILGSYWLVMQLNNADAWSRLTAALAASNSPPDPQQNVFADFLNQPAHTVIPQSNTQPAAIDPFKAALRAPSPTDTPASPALPQD